MNAFIEFLREYWFQLLTALAFVLEIVFIFIKRKPKSVDDFKLCLNEVLASVPDFVSFVEEPGNGTEKKLSVLKLAKCSLVSKLGRKLSDFEIGLVDNVVSSQIETVLSTPTKKEKINEK